MQDVIFNGTQNRKALSYCEVSLVFDNTDKIFKDLDYTEVVFTRKLYRSGESEYYVNRKLARLKDIVDYLREGGVSKEGYTIIGQGKVAEILSSKPEDRRTIFEEAVGIAKTKQKRLETTRKLDRTRDNIVRISDITSELERQIEPLKKQAEKTRSYMALSDELKYHEINAYLYKSSHASQSKATINGRIRDIVNELALRSAELDDAIKSYNRHQKEVADADEYVKQVNDELLEKTQEFERQSGNAKVYGEKSTISGPKSKGFVRRLRTRKIVLKNSPKKFRRRKTTFSNVKSNSPNSKSRAAKSVPNSRELSRRFPRANRTRVTLRTLF